MSLDAALEARFDKIDAQFTTVNEQFVAVNEQFAGVNEQFVAVNARFEDISVQLDKLATAVVKGFDRIDAALETKADKKDMERVLGLLDELIKRNEISDDERLVMGHQLDRLDRWTHELAAKIGHELSV